MKSPHEYYEQLCSLAASGQLSRDEWAELGEHLKTCRDCQGPIYASGQIGFQVLPLVASEHATTPLPSNLVERVIARVKAQRATLPGVSSTQRRPVAAFSIGAKRIALVPWAVAAVLLATSVVLSIKLTTKPYGWQKSVNVSESKTPPQRPVEGTPVTRAPVQDDQGLSKQLRSMESQLAATAEHHRQDMESAKRENDELSSQVTRLETSNRKDLDSRDAEIAGLKRDLEKSRSQETADHTASLVTEAEVRSLREQLAKQGTQLDELRQQNAAGLAAKEMLSSRNLHMQEIYGWDENSRPTPAFGRLFYAEGQKLEFYAFDLATPNGSDTKIAFYLWGEAAGSKGNRLSVVRLGKFNLDSSAENRWALIVKDRNLLTGLRSVFVTAESSGNAVTQPTGTPILSGFVARKPNHP